jgi:hypothetical protein
MQKTFGPSLMRASLTPEYFGTGASANVAVLKHLC